MKIVTLATDYLVIGAGASSLAFVDTLLTEQPDATVMLVDKHAAPGGHWNDAYGFVQLHQPSLLYGVASKSIEGNWLKLMMTKRMMPWHHRASKAELLQYYQSVMDSWLQQGRVQYFPNCSYDFSSPAFSSCLTDDDNEEDVLHKFDSLDGSTSYRVQVGVKLVNGILGECKVPSQCPVEFPVDPDIQLITPNQLYNQHDGHPKRSSKKKRFWSRNRSVQQEEQQMYVVLGGGKTGMDTVVYLQRHMGVAPQHIYWVIPNDVWMLNRDGGTPDSWAKALVANNLDMDQAALQLERDGLFVRLDKNVMPTKFRFPVIGKDELELLQSVPKNNVIRHGRVTSISLANNNGVIQVDFGPKQDPWYFSQKDTCFIHCTSPGPFNGKNQTDLFVSDKMMNLSILFAPPVPISMSCMAKLESARRQGTLDLDFGHKLLQERGWNNENGKVPKENDILKQLFTGFDVSAGPQGQLKPLALAALCLTMMYKNPVASYQWMKNNRLSFFSIPTFKAGVYESMVTLSNNYTALGYTKVDANMFSLLADKLKPLEGK